MGKVLACMLVVIWPRVRFYALRIERVTWLNFGVCERASVFYTGYTTPTTESGSSAVGLSPATMLDSSSVALKNTFTHGGRFGHNDAKAGAGEKAGIMRVKQAGEGARSNGARTVIV